MFARKEILTEKKSAVTKLVRVFPINFSITEK